MRTRTLFMGLVAVSLSLMTACTPSSVATADSATDAMNTFLQNNKDKKWAEVIDAYPDAYVAEVGKDELLAQFEASASNPNMQMEILSYNLGGIIDTLITDSITYFVFDYSQTVSLDAYAEDTTQFPMMEMMMVQQFGQENVVMRNTDPNTFSCDLTMEAEAFVMSPNDVVDWRIAVNEPNPGSRDFMIKIVPAELYDAVNAL